MSSKRKKRLLALAVIVICFAIVGMGTYAYLTRSNRARNVITTGKVDISIVEQQLVDGEFVPYPDTPVAVMPSSEVSKIVAVRCEEEQAYIRMQYSVRFEDAEGNELDLSPDVVEIPPVGENWTEKDGWFYYNRPLSAGEVTEPLFETVKFATIAMGNEYQRTVMVLRIHAQSVQTANNPAPNGDVTAVVGWPKA